MREFWTIFLTGALILWVVALVSHLSGNETAINALIGIPLGVAYFAGLLHFIEKLVE